MNGYVDKAKKALYNREYYRRNKDKWRRYNQGRTRNRASSADDMFDDPIFDQLEADLDRERSNSGRNSSSNSSSRNSSGLTQEDIAWLNRQPSKRQINASRKEVEKIYPEVKAANRQAKKTQREFSDRSKYGSKYYTSPTVPGGAYLTQTGGVTGGASRIARVFNKNSTYGKVKRARELEKKINKAKHIAAIEQRNEIATRDLRDKSFGSAWRTGAKAIKNKASKYVRGVIDKIKKDRGKR